LHKLLMFMFSCVETLLIQRHAIRDLICVPVSCQVIDNPSRLKPDDWSRVACIIAHGKEWQFKGWAVSSPVELFYKARGIYFKWDNEKAPVDTVGTLTNSACQRRVRCCFDLLYTNVFVFYPFLVLIVFVVGSRCIHIYFGATSVTAC